MNYVALGKTYPVTLPVIGKTTMDIPVEQITKDAMEVAVADMKTRASKVALPALGIGLLLGAVYLVVKR